MEIGMKKVTVVIPVYKDWSTLTLCIESLKKYLDTRHTVILVNDVSSEADELEQKIQDSIQGFENFLYYRNPQNMGFVKTCNRAVMELDQTENDILLLNSDTEVTEGFLEEMLEVLYTSEKHGVVCPRSNCATILTVPIKNNDCRDVTPQQSFACYQSIKEMLPRYAVLPTGVGFCFLIKRNLIQMYGLFDEVYGMGYNEENDFCMRINQYGFNIIMANKAYVYHFEGKSFGTRKSVLEVQNGQRLKERYPYYETIVNRYFNKEINPIDYYADLIDDGFYQKKRILYSLYALPAAYNGTAEHGLSLLEAFIKKYDEKYDIHILVNRDGDQFHKVSKKYRNVHYPDNITGTFHIAYVPSQIFHMEHLFILNRTCLKIAFCMQDIICIRSNYLLVNDWEQQDIFRQSIRFADAIVGISDFSIDDTKAYYAEEFAQRDIPYQRVYEATNKKYVEKEGNHYKAAFDKYFVVFGNTYKHKVLQQTIEQFEKSKHNFIIIGSKTEGNITPNIYGYRSGNLESTFIDYLMYHSQGIVFPSVYEGLGLPIFNAIDYEKKIIVNDNELNRELKEYFAFYEDGIKMYHKFSDMEGLFDEIAARPEVQYTNGERVIRTWEEVAVDIEEFLAKIMAVPVNVELINERWKTMRYLENIHRCYVPTVAVPQPENSIKKLFFRKSKNWLKKHTPRVYNFLDRLKNGKK